MYDIHVYVCPSVGTYKCYFVGYREYTTIDGFFPVKLVGYIGQKKSVLWGTQKNRREQWCTPQINVYMPGMRQEIFEKNRKIT